MPLAGTQMPCFLSQLCVPPRHGCRVGVTLGEAVGLSLGPMLGAVLGARLGRAVGLVVGLALGLLLGDPLIGLAVGRSVQTCAPFPDERPAAQARHFVWPTDAAKRPAAQRLHAVVELESASALPGAQGVQAVLPWSPLPPLLTCPTPHTLHLGGQWRCRG